MSREERERAASGLSARSFSALATKIFFDWLYGFCEFGRFYCKTC